MDEGNGMADLLVLKRTEPSGLGGWIARNPGSDGLDDQDVCEPRDDGLAARTQLLGLDRHQSQRALDPLRLGRAPGVEGDHSGQQGDQSISGRMVESNHAADDGRRRASPTVAQDLVPIAHLFAWQVEELRGSHSRFARQPVAGAVRHEREIAGLQDVILRAFTSSTHRPDVTAWNIKQSSNAGRASAQGAVNSERA